MTAIEIMIKYYKERIKDLEDDLKEERELSNLYASLSVECKYGRNREAIREIEKDIIVQEKKMWG